MKIEDILNALPSKEDIANALSGQTRNNTGGDLLTALGIFGTGLLLGAGLAFLLAPTTGQQLRHDLAEKIGDVGHKLARSEEGSIGRPADAA
jgi:hypothetical protein